ncbi:MAG: Gldg family protein [Pseudomonadales bacterium]|nr:Gldg family protein [Pseudomonadales bacterium]
MMNKKLLFSGVGLGLVAIITVVMIGISNGVMNTARFDLTENQLYTVSEGTKNIVEGLEQPVELYFFYSNEVTKEIPDLRHYAKRVEELLQEYELLAPDKITLHVIDPVPFSEEEDQAMEYGLQGVAPSAISGDKIYFGLVGKNAAGSQEIIGFFQPNKEQFLEYELSQMLYRLSHEKSTVIGLMSSLQMQGGFDMASRQPTPAWMLMSEIDRVFDVNTVDLTAKEIDKEIDVLMIVHPKDLPDRTLYAIDQFVLRGGKAMIFVDPNAELDIPMGGMPSDPSVTKTSELKKLFDQWGVELTENSVLGDAKYAMVVGMGRESRSIRHLGLQGYGPANFVGRDVVTDQLELINVGTAGILSQREGATTDFTPLIESSSESMPIDLALFNNLRDPAMLADGFIPTGDSYAVAARVKGIVNTAFPDGAPNVEEVNTEDADAEVSPVDSDQEVEDVGTSHLKVSKSEINVLIVADTDILTDRLWVRVQDFFGQRVASPWANNADFIVNGLEHLSGSSDLIGIRSRGQFSRPFTRVQEIQRLAEEKFRKSEKELSLRLQETERELMALQEPPENGILSLSEEQEQELIKFQDEKAKIRKQLRDVQHQLNKDIKDLGAGLKIINIAAVPLILTLFALGFALIKRRRESLV